MNHDEVEDIYALTCPYCWQAITIRIDVSGEDQRFVEDCEVCCQPIEFRVARGFDDRWSVSHRATQQG